jgi:hypothetical protein
MYVWWVAIEQGGFRIVEPYHIDRRPVFNLNPQKPRRNFRQRFNRAEPPTDYPAHTPAARILAVRPPANRSSLREASTHLAGPNIESSCPFNIRNVFIQFARDREFLSAEWRESDRFRQRVALVPENPKKVRNLTVHVVVRLNSRRATIKKNGSRPGKRLAVMMAAWQQREQPVEV